MGKQRSPFRVPRPGSAIYEAADAEVAVVAGEAITKSLLNQPGCTALDDAAEEIAEIYFAAGKLAEKAGALLAEKSGTEPKKTYYWGSDAKMKELTPEQLASLHGFLRKQDAAASVSLDKDPRGGTRSHIEPPVTKVLNKDGEEVGTITPTGGTTK